MNTIDKLWALFTNAQTQVQCIKDRDYLTERVTTLSRELGSCIGTINITETSGGKICSYDTFSDYDIICADIYYQKYSYDDWITILTRLYENISDKLEYTPEICDCDDFALLYSGILSYSAYKSGLTIQPAFCMLWSRTHAFNGFVDNQNRMWIFEPQNNKIIGQLRENNDKTYDVQKIWFMS